MDKVRLEEAVNSCIEEICSEGPLGEDGQKRVAALKELAAIQNETLKTEADIEKLKADQKTNWFKAVTGALAGAVGVVVNAQIARGILRAEIDGTVSSRAFPHAISNLGDAIRRLRA